MSRVCWVTGGSRGIGAACVRALAPDYLVAVGYTKGKEEAEALCLELNRQGFTALPFRTDVTSREEILRTVEEIRNSLGSIRLLVTAAGIAWTGLTQEMTEEELVRVVDTDLCGTVRCCQAVLPDMIRAQAGSIVTVSSVWGICGASCETVYSAAKAGVIGFTRALAQEVAPSGIRVNCVAPGVIRTRMLNNLNEEELESLREEIPLGRLGTPEDVAETVRFAAESSYTTGQVFSPNGGFVI